MTSIVTDKTEVIPFRIQVPASSGVLKLSERLKADCTIEDIQVRFYPGQEGDLHVMPKIKRTGNRVEDLITFPAGTDQFLAGDDDTWRLDVGVDAQLDDEIQIIYENVDPTYEYTLMVFVTVDYLGGKNRVR